MTVSAFCLLALAVSVLWSEAPDVEDEKVIDTTKMKKAKEKVSRFMRKTLLYYQDCYNR
ncbi:conserved hypothetical protein [Alteromonas sp. 38]|nr:conserved hypothetical protein [Alteromonas sp. 154]VXC44176.1 conserved hypothetical protein [Alteromonas sp. 38]